MPIKRTGRDGREITIPDGCLGLQGPDGRMVSIPPDALGLGSRLIKPTRR
jgi:hypothetical protein